MFTVALIGPDGVGKTAIGRRLEAMLPMPSKYIYMGVDLYSSNHMLPTSHLLRFVKRRCGVKKDTAGPQDSRAVRSRPKGFVRGTLRALKVSVSLIHRLSEQWYRQGLAWYYCRRGRVVVFDRHFFADYYAYDVEPNGVRRPLDRRIHGYLLDRFYPRPDLLIYLDASPEVLLERKGEGTHESLARRRGEYLELRRLVPQFVVVNAERPLEKVVDEVKEVIRGFHRSRLDAGREVRDASNYAH